jgi:cell division protein FtsL
MPIDESAMTTASQTDIMIYVIVVIIVLMITVWTIHVFFDMLSEFE